ncbi:MAG TPA: sulfatase-like hydrolase/transferase [Pirellulaceae bacterium]|nr:sulfatase-like hydrolase/transferase [Pirellulaceae bacterium]
MTSQQSNRAHPTTLNYYAMNLHPRLRLPIPLLARFLVIVSTLVVCAGASSPNVLLIYTDDHAQWAVGGYGNKEVHTPHMDRLAIDGMRFTRGFTKAVCSPSRAMVLTGLYSHRVGIPDFIPHGNPVVSGNGLPPGTSTIATVLKKAGYRTGLIGKWHLGYGEKYYPQKFGFDVAEGFRYIAPDKEIGSVGKIPFLVDGKEVPRFRYDKQHTDILADRAINFIENQGDQPFFLYLSIYLPHLPWEAVPGEDRAHYEGKKLSVPDLGKYPEATIGENDLRELMRSYYANITCADRNIGRVLAALDSLSLTKDTLVFFIGDNGFNVGQHGLLGKGNALILGTKDRKPNMFDHSVLVPFIVRWPGVIKAGSVSDAMVSTIDVLPTLMEISGAKTRLQLDGQSMLPILESQRGVKWRDEYCDTYDMTYLKEDHMRMIRTDDWKLVFHFDAAGQPLPHRGHELFNLTADPEELKNLYTSDTLAPVRQRLEARLRKWIAEYAVQ